MWFQCEVRFCGSEPCRQVPSSQSRLTSLRLRRMCRILPVSHRRFLIIMSARHLKTTLLQRGLICRSVPVLTFFSCKRTFSSSCRIQAVCGFSGLFIVLPGSQSLFRSRPSIGSEPGSEKQYVTCRSHPVRLWGLWGVINDPLSSQSVYLKAARKQWRPPSK